MSAVRRSPLRRVGQGLWWALTLQLPARLRERREARRLAASGLFDTEFYLTRYPDVGPSGLDPISHYLRFGAAEGRDPSPHFDGRFYLERNPDVAASGMNPLAHFVLRGAREGRDPSPFFDTVYYVESNPFVERSGLNPLLHYARVGARCGRAPSRRTAVAGLADERRLPAPTTVRILDRAEQIERAGGAAALSFAP